MTTSAHPDRQPVLSTRARPDTARLAGWVLRLVTAAALVVDAVVHLQLASLYQLAAPGGIGQGNLFRIEAVLALAAAGFVLLAANRLSYLIAFAVAASALVAVLLYRYVDVPAIGPIPSMYEPLWFAKKTVTALAEGLATLTGAAGLVLAMRAGRNRNRVSGRD